MAGSKIRSDLQPSEFAVVLTQSFALGCDMAAPLALSKSMAKAADSWELAAFVLDGD